jgi:hypothetical protein
MEQYIVSRNIIDFSKDKLRDIVKLMATSYEDVIVGEKAEITGDNDTKVIVIAGPIKRNINAGDSPRRKRSKNNFFT